MDYEKREDELFSNYLKNFNLRKNDKICFFPPINRFPKLKEPITTINVGILSNLYSVVPFYGSSIIMIYPIPELYFKDVHGFPPEDIQKMVDFAKAEGRIQFALGGRASRYKDLDYLDPIFDLNPPRFSVLPERTIVDNNCFKKYRVEFYTLSSLGFFNYMHKKINNIRTEGISQVIPKNELENCARSFAFAKCLGYYDLTDMIEQMLVQDVQSADRLLGIAEHFIYRTKLSPFNRIHTYCGDFLSFLRSGIQNSGPTDYNTTYDLPFEVGRFLLENKKLTNASGNFEACKDLCYNYRQSDLHNLLINLQDGLKDRNVDLLTSTRTELDSVLDNLWDESDSIRKRSNLIKSLLPVSIGIIGELAGYALKSDNLGVLASAGLLVADRILGSKKEGVAELLSKWGKEDYLIGVFDFKKKIPKSLLDK